MPLVQLAIDLLKASDPEESAAALDRAVAALGLPGCTLLLVDDSRQFLWFHPADRPAPPGLETDSPHPFGLDLANLDPMGVIMRGRTVASGSSPLWPEAETVGPDDFWNAFHCTHKTTGAAEPFALFPLGRDDLLGALLVGPADRSASGRPEDLARLIGVIEPFAARILEHGKLVVLSQESKAVTAIAEVLARPRLSLDRRLNDCLNIILDVLQAATGSIMIKKGRRLVVRAATNPNVVGKSQAISSDSISAFVAKTGEILNLGDVSQQDRFLRCQAEPNRYISNQVLSAPIFSGKRLLGVLNVTSRLHDRSFSRAEEEQVMRFLDRIGALIKGAELTDAVQREKKRLKIANEELKRLERLKQDLTNMVVHDLKGPLAEVAANLHLLKDLNLDEFPAELVESGLIGVDDLEQMIANLLDISRMEEGRLVVEPAPTSLKDTFDRVAGRLATLYAMSEVTVDNRIPTATPPVLADSKLLERIIQNLMTNAVSHTPAGTTVTFTAETEDGWIEASTADQGPGVPEEHRESIFRMFTQIRDRELPRTSTGLGLTFCRMAVMAHGGRIWVQDAPEGGADFRFRLPLAKEDK